MYEYPFGNGQQLNLDWFLSEWKNLLAAWEAEKNGVEGALQAEIDRAEAALADVFAARDAAAQSAANALESKNAAAQSASDASGYLSTVQQNATAAQNAAQSAAESQTAAGNSASAAAQSETAAGNSASAAAQSETAAGNSASAAAQSETAAGNSASAAAQSETAAGNSASAAAQSADDAEDAAASVQASTQQIATNTADINNLKESIVIKAPAIVNSTRGTIAHFTDGADNITVKALTIEGAESANVMRVGKNLWDDSVPLTNIEAYATNGAPDTYVGRDLHLPEGTYILSYNETTTAYIYGNVVNADGSWVSTFILTSPSAKTPSFTLSDGQYIKLFVASGSSTELTRGKVQLEVGTTVSQYEPYHGNMFSYPSESVTTLYGVNNIWSEAGNIVVTYYADTKLYIDNKITELQALALENIGG